MTPRSSSTCLRRAGSPDTSLNQWLPALAAMSRRAMIVVREESNLAPIGRHDAADRPRAGHPRRRATRSPGVKIAFYVANAGRNVQLLREPTIKHVFLNHGDSDKATSANPVSRVYDEVWVAGQAAIDRYEAAGVHIPAERFAVDRAPAGRRAPVGPRRRVSAACPVRADVGGHLRGGELQLARDRGRAIIRTILQERPDIAVIFKPHPAYGPWRPEMRRRSRRSSGCSRSLHMRTGTLVVAQPGDASLNDCFAMPTC